MTPFKADVEAIIAKAESQIGVTEQPFGSNRTPYGKWYGLDGNAWCAMFTSWCFAHGGSPLPEITPSTSDSGFAYCPSGVAWAKRQGIWRASSSGYEPKRGDIILFDFIGRPSHVGIVTGRTPDGRVATIEGNTNPAGSRTGGMVMRHNRSRAGSTIGYVEVTPSATTPATTEKDPLMSLTDAQATKLANDAQAAAVSAAAAAKAATRAVDILEGRPDKDGKGGTERPTGRAAGTLLDRVRDGIERLERRKS